MASFIFVSSNKVCGDHPDRLPFVELPTRWEVDPAHPYTAHGVDEAMAVDQATHSLMGASTLSADVLLREYG
jgi:CDP-paratose 2-epimerase